MSRRTKSVALEMMILKKPTALDELINTIQKPKGAIPNFGLPRWKIMPLESKIPMIAGPEGSYHFTRNKLGKKLWVGSADAEFNLNDPCNYEADWKYDPLHDEHLARFFSQPTNIRRMIKLGLITKKLDAKCSIRDYNIYRKYLKTLHNDSINKEIKRRAQMEFERRALNLAEKFAEKDAKSIIVREKRIAASSKLLDKNKLEEEAKLRKQRDQQIKVEERLKGIELNRIKAKKLRIQKAWELAEVSRQKREMAAYVKRQKIVKTIQQWRDSEYQRKTAKAKKKLDELEEKRKAVEEKWQLRREMQEKQIEKENFLQHCSHEERALNIEAYNAKVEKERARMRRLSEQYKVFVKCYINRHVVGHLDGNCCVKRSPLQRQLREKDLSNSCSAKSYRANRNKLNKMEKENVKTKRKQRRKKNKRKRKKTAIQSVPEPEHQEISTIFEISPSPQEPSIKKDNCKCEKIKAEWLENQPTSNN